jgi:hypothetical protein
MNTRTDEREERNDSSATTDEDARIIRLVREHYAPAPMTRARAAAFDEELLRRAHTRSRGTLPWAPAMAFASLLAIAVWMGPFATEPMTGSTGEEMGAALDDADFALLFPQDVDYGQESARSDLLPDDYVAIASELLLEG